MPEVPASHRDTWVTLSWFHPALSALLSLLVRFYFGLASSILDLDFAGVEGGENCGRGPWIRGTAHRSDYNRGSRDRTERVLGRAVTASAPSSPQIPAKIIEDC
jgi:hypothetical protein